MYEQNYILFLNSIMLEKTLYFNPRYDTRCGFMHSSSARDSVCSCFLLCFGLFTLCWLWLSCPLCWWRVSRVKISTTRFDRSSSRSLRRGPVHTAPLLNYMSESILSLNSGKHSGRWRLGGVGVGKFQWAEWQKQHTGMLDVTDQDTVPCCHFHLFLRTELLPLLGFVRRHPKPVFLLLDNAWGENKILWMCAVWGK